MHIDQLKEHFPDEAACRLFFENWIWATGRRCPRCKSDRSYRLTGRVGLYECAACKKQFSVTAQTPFYGQNCPCSHPVEVASTKPLGGNPKDCMIRLFCSTLAA